MDLDEITDDVQWALAHTADDAEQMDAVNGADDEATKAAQRLAVTVRRLAREAGYEVLTT